MAYGRGGQGKVSFATKDPFSISNYAVKLIGFLSKHMKKAGMGKQKIDPDIPESLVSKFYKDTTIDLAKELIPDINAPSGFVGRSRQPKRADLSSSSPFAGVNNPKFMQRYNSLANRGFHQDSNVSKLFAQAGATPSPNLRVTGPTIQGGSQSPSKSLKGVA